MTKEEFRSIRLGLGLKQVELAKILGCKQTYVSKLELGKAEITAQEAMIMVSLNVEDLPKEKVQSQPSTSQAPVKQSTVEEASDFKIVASLIIICASLLLIGFFMGLKEGEKRAQDKVLIEILEEVKK